VDLENFATTSRCCCQQTCRRWSLCWPKLRRLASRRVAHKVCFTSVDRDALTPLFRFVADLLYTTCSYDCAATDKITTGVGNRGGRASRADTCVFSPRERVARFLCPTHRMITQQCIQFKCLFGVKRLACLKVYMTRPRHATLNSRFTRYIAAGRSLYRAWGVCAAVTVWLIIAVYKKQIQCTLPLKLRDFSVQTTVCFLRSGYIV